MIAPNKLLNAKKLSNGWGNVRFAPGPGGRVPGTGKTGRVPVRGTERGRT
jgi:hypothetical protein